MAKHGPTAKTASRYPSLSFLDDLTTSELEQALGYALTLVKMKPTLMIGVAAIRTMPDRAEEILSALERLTPTDHLADPDLDELPLPRPQQEMVEDSVLTPWHRHRTTVDQVLERLAKKAEKLHIDTSAIDRMQALLCVGTNNPLPEEFWPLVTDVRAVIRKLVRRESSPPSSGSRTRRVDISVDEIGLDMLGEAWNKGSGYRPTWRQLAKAVLPHLHEAERPMNEESALTALKQRCPKTKALWNEIGAELEQRKRLSMQAQEGKTLPKLPE